MDNNLPANVHASGVEFLIVECDTGLTFADSALRSKDPDRIALGRRNARAAYDTILRFVGRIGFSPGEASALHAKMARLKSKLVDLGEHL
ncbi:MAG TPA: hypothetical protein VJQ50_21035 [Terriglobales bacterium]|nr:hypothetical protein [Terriglobales bacterium]